MSLNRGSPAGTPENQEPEVLQKLQQTAAKGVEWGSFSGRFVRRGRGNRDAAVLLLFGPSAPLLRAGDAPHPTNLQPEDLDVLLLQRSTKLGDHPGQVAFPGGRVDKGDGSPVAAALREAQEETGVDPRGVDVLGALESLPLPASDHQVTPVLGWWRQPSAVYAVDQRESSRVFRVPLGQLVDPDNRGSAVMERFGVERQGPAFTVGGTTVWGFTAIILTDLLGTLGWDKPWDPHRPIAIDH